MYDLRTVVWKEIKEFLRQRGTIRGTVLMMVIPAAILGFIFPLQTGRMWVESPLSLATWVWVPMMMVVTMIADSFAGERERHTLETLLASRLSDSTILYGKICAAVCQALATTFAIVLLGLLTVNIFHGRGEVLLFSFNYFTMGAVLSVLTAFFMAGAGVLVSLRAATVRQAQQTLSFGFIVFVFLPVIVIPILPDTVKNSIEVSLKTLGIAQFIFLILGILLLVDIILLKAASARFKRSRLLLD